MYDCFDKIIIEHGAINVRVRAQDAAGNHPTTETCTSLTDPGEVLYPACKSAVSKKLGIMDGHTTQGAYQVCVAQARHKNSYICNETNYNALQAMNEAHESGKPKEVYFIHIPYPKDKNDFNYDKLADAVSEVITNLVDEEPVSNSSTGSQSSTNKDFYSNS